MSMPSDVAVSGDEPEKIFRDLPEQRERLGLDCFRRCRRLFARASGYKWQSHGGCERRYRLATVHQ